MRIIAEPLRSAIAQVAIEKRWFEEDGKPKTESELANPTKTHSSFLNRFIRVLKSRGIISKASPNTYRANDRM
jgi:hypothetical protein